MSQQLPPNLFTLYDDNRRFLEGKRSRPEIGVAAMGLLTILAIGIIPALAVAGWVYFPNAICRGMTIFAAIVLSFQLYAGIKSDIRKLHRIFADPHKFIIDATVTNVSEMDFSRSGRQLVAIFEFTSPKTGKLIKDYHKRAVTRLTFAAGTKVLLSQPTPAKVLYLNEDAYWLL